MGKAAYDRGSAVISRQLCAESGCRGCVRCSEYKPTPRPSDWGSKTAAKALRKATGILSYMRRRGDPDPTVPVLADMCGYDTYWGRATCVAAAEKALSAKEAADAE